MPDEILFLNQAVSMDREAALVEFLTWPTESQKKGLVFLVLMIGQASLTSDHLNMAHKKMPPGYLPPDIEHPIFLKDGAFDGRNWADDFSFLLETYCLANKQRIDQQCKGQCSHWWHQELPQP